jgi:hypothetical protein
MIIPLTELINSIPVKEKTERELKKKWLTDWAGDLKLIQIHDIYR